MAYSNRTEYKDATILDQDLLDRCQDNLEFGLEMALDIQTPDGLIHASDRNKYVGNVFYEAITELPSVRRSLGDWLNPQLEFSTLTFSISNVDGRFNKYLQAGDNYESWINKGIDLRVGLRDVSSSYFSIFTGFVSDIGGIQRDRSRITINARDHFDKYNIDFPKVVLNLSNFPDLDDNMVGLTLPVIYGDWTTSLTARKLIPDNPASPTEMVAQVPAYPINGKNAGVLAGTTRLKLQISNDNLSYFDTTTVYLKRGDNYYKFNSADITGVVNNKVFEIKQISSGGVTLVDGSLYQYASGDLFFVKVKGIDLGSYDDNILEQAKHILINFADVSPTEFDSNWNTLRDKASPVESAIANIKSRVWVQESQSAIEYVLSMLEQVRIEFFVSKEKKIKLSTVHLDDFEANPSFVISNWDIEFNTFTPRLDDRNIWNRAQAGYSYDPTLKELSRATSVYRNQASIDQLGKEISKKVLFPNLYIEQDVIRQLKEYIKIASAGLELIEVTLTPRALLKELGEFVLINVNFGATMFTNVPAMIRDIGYEAKGLRIPVKLWSFQMLNFTGHMPSYNGIVGGSDATITEET